MSECLNVEIRELLPEYLHGRLRAVAHRRVEEHLAGCADCAAELAVLRSVREAFASVPAVDVGTVVRALPKPRVRRRRYFGTVTALQIAAAVSFVSLGGISLVVARSFFGGEQPALVADSAIRFDSSAPAGVTTGISFGGGLGDLADEDLESLMSAVESIDALPPAEPAELSIGTIGGVGP